MFAHLRLRSLLATSVLALAAAAAAAEQFPFVEKFDPPGAAQRWRPLAGKWEFGPGFVKQTDAAFDCGATVAVRPEGAYWLAVRFRPESSFVGGGLFFGLPSVEKKNGGMMIRVDPDGRVLWGWIDEGGTFQYYADAMFDDDGDREQELAVAVDPARNAFNVYHHGERIATNVRTFHTQGFVGLQSSGGPHTFVKFECRPATQQELEGLKAPGEYSRIVDVIGNDECVIALRRGADFLTAYDAVGAAKTAAKVGELGIPPGTDDDARPVALAWDRPAADGRRDILVLGCDGTTIWRVGPDFHVRDGKPLVQIAEMRGAALAVDQDGRIFVADAALPGIRVLDAAGKQLAVFGEKGNVVAHDRSDPKSAGKFKAPRGIAVRLGEQSSGPVGNRSHNAPVEIVVADRENYTYVVYTFDPGGNKFEFVRNGPWIPYPAQVLFDRQGKLLMAGMFEYYRGYGALRVMGLDGIGEKTFLAHALGNLSDKVRVCQGPGGKYHVVDPDKDRVMILPPDFVEKLPEFKYTDDGGVQLTMTKVDGTKLVTTSTEKDKNGRIVARQQGPVCATWPPLRPDELTTYALPPATSKGRTYVIDMPVLVAVFKQADEVREEKGERKVTHVEIDTTGVIDRLRRELEVARQFYWRVSHATLNLQFDYMVVDEPGAQVDGGWIQPTPARELVNKARTKAGLPPIDKDHSLIGLHPMAGFDPKDTDDPGYVGGGGLTPYAYSGYALWNHGQGWLFAHEWGHQLDAYFEKSGFPDWWLNHPDGTVHIGRYGEHWDCNAFLCRLADKMNWLRFAFGKTRAVADADGDGLADNDPTLPLDEARFGSDPAKIDTDGDGLSDLAELCAGTFSSSDPRKPDTNGDGVPDGRDPYPQFAVRPVIGAPARSDVGPIGTIRNAWADADVHGSYGPDALEITFILRKPARQLFVPVDWNNDGWFVGQDNIYYSVDLDWPDAEPGKPAAEAAAPSIKAAQGCEARVQHQGGATQVTLKLPRPPTRGPLKPGECVGICPRVQNGGGTIAFLLDPWQLLTLELK